MSGTAHCKVHKLSNLVLLRQRIQHKPLHIEKCLPSEILSGGRGANAKCLAAQVLKEVATSRTAAGTKRQAVGLHVQDGTAWRLQQSAAHAGCKGRLQASAVAACKASTVGVEAHTG